MTICWILGPVVRFYTLQNVEFCPFNINLEQVDTRNRPFRDHGGERPDATPYGLATQALLNDRIHVGVGQFYVVLSAKIRLHRIGMSSPVA